MSGTPVGSSEPFRAGYEIWPERLFSCPGAVAHRAPTPYLDPAGGATPLLTLRVDP